MRKILLLFIATFTLLSCNAQQKEGAELVSPAQFEKRMAADSGQLIDVRTPKEFSAGHIEGAKNVHLYDKDFSQHVDKLDKKKTVYVYCKAGGRSSEAVGILKEKGFKHVVELDGGTDAWTEAGKPLK
ncbi:rhodanese-like domain-containing protein [uncultured Flavobacterium sp.]|uniref:rhodanese-like domain-containing protein n=1 Tax=uncultured Flavobacterium sp. TaxID=165435 RepID=UPI0025F6B5F5|nr:rhodanese-like domain-containing protein [uncultured Flavobacterium sp.]